MNGTKLRNGEVLQYKMNGLSSFLLVMGGTVLALSYDVHVLDFMVTDYISLLSASLLVSVLAALASHYMTGLRSTSGNSGIFVYDFWMGRTLNPRIGKFDVKVFCELRPGLFLWSLLDLAFLVYQYTSIGRVTDSMILVVLFQTWYIADSVINEKAVLTTMDVTTDGFGFMLAFGDLTWVPFTYSLQARYLSSQTVDLGIYKVSGILAVQLLGYVIFRGSNSQKDEFKRDPSRFKHATIIKTQTGGLLASGWWGYARHVNYLGDWIMAWSWCLPTGANPITYFYVAYFAVLLIHRERRDDEKCAAKYGPAWTQYKKLVRWRIIPYVY